MATNDELRASAERLLAARDYWEDYWHYSALLQDGRRIAEAYLAKHPTGESPSTKRWRGKIQFGMGTAQSPLREVDVVEVLPGDIDPDAAIRAREWASNLFEAICAIDSESLTRVAIARHDLCRRFLSILKGEGEKAGGVE